MEMKIEYVLDQLHDRNETIELAWAIEAIIAQKYDMKISDEFDNNDGATCKIQIIKLKKPLIPWKRS